MELTIGLIGILTTFLLGLYPLTSIFSLVTKSIRKTASNSDVNSKAWESLKKLKSPLRLPIIGHLYYLLRPNFDVLPTLLDLNRKYGPIFNVVFPNKHVVVINDPAAVQRVLMSPNHVNKDSLYKILVTGSAAGGSFLIDYDQWHGHRKVLSRAFTYKSLCHQLSLMNHHSKVLISELGNVGNTVFNELLHCRILKLVLHTVIDSDMFTDDQFRNFHHYFSQGKDLCGTRLVRPWQLVPFIWYFHPNNMKLERARNEHDGFVETVLAKYRSMGVQEKANSETPEDDVGERPMASMMEMMIQAGMSDSEIVSETMTILAAGHETTAWTIIFLLIRLGMTPEIQSQCMEEIDGLYESKTNEDLTMEDLTNLKYVERCILESLRHMPIVPFVARRIETPLKISEDITVPAGVTALMSPYAIHRDPAIYPEPDKFDPDRFLPEECKKRHQCAFIPFLTGPRNCVGWKTAIMTIKVITVFLLRHYRVGTRLKSWDEVDYEFSISLIMRNPEGVIQLEKRKKEGE